MADIGFKECTRAAPCPVCKRVGWCAVTLDGAMAHCHRVQSERATSTGWLHVLRDDLPAMPALPPPPMSVMAKLFSAQLYHSRLDDDPVMTDGLAAELGVDVTALARLEPRYDRHQRAHAFPMRNGDGDMVGIRLRALDGTKRAVKHSKAGLFYDAAVTEAREVWVCEGPTDTAAAMTLGYVAVGRPSCLGNTDDLRVLFKRWGVRRMVVVADNDEAKRRPDNSLWYPGREGAMMLVKAMGGVEYKLLMTPTKDIRKWVCNGVTRRECDDVVAVLKWKQGGVG